MEIKDEKSLLVMGIRVRSSKSLVRCFIQRPQMAGIIRCSCFRESKIATAALPARHSCKGGAHRKIIDFPVSVRTSPSTARRCAKLIDQGHPVGLVL